LSLNASSDQDFNYIENFENLILNFSFEDPKLEKKINNDENYYRVKINGLSNTFQYNKPIIPVKNIQILIPNNMILDKIEIDTSEGKLIKTGINLELGKKLLPVNNYFLKDNFFDNKVIDNPCYNNLYSIVGEYKIRGFPILYINLYPVQYDKGWLFFYENIELNISFKKSNSDYCIRGVQRDFELVNSIVENPFHLITYNNEFKMLNNNELDYIIITSENFANSELENNFQTLIESKINKGLSAKIFTVEDIISNPDYFVNGVWGDNNPSNPFYESEITNNIELFNDTQAKIRNFIRYAYLELGADYVLLGGDADTDDELENIIPSRGLFANESGLPLYNSNLIAEEEEDIPSDIYYSNLDGNFNYDLDEHFGESSDRNNITNIDEADLLSEIFVGRACVDKEEEIANFVMKTINYDNLKSDPYLSKILFVGEFLGFPGISAYGGNYKDLIIPRIPLNYNVEKLYDRDLQSKWSKNDIIDTINNATPHIINHDGHSYYGYNMRMTNSDIKSLKNTKYFFAYSHGCMAGGFDNPAGYDCIAEYLTVESPNGAFAVIMNSRYGLGSEDSLDSPSQFLDDSFFKALYDEDIRQIGRANHYSKEDNIWRIDENGVRWVYYETNLLGDPEISIKNPYSSDIDIIINFNCPTNNSFYLFNNKICELPFLDIPLIFGQINIQTDVYSNPEGYIYCVDFYLDNESKFRDDTYPYEWKLDTKLFGKHRINVVAYTINANQEIKNLDFLIFNYDFF
jgi:hypothetical protein